MKKSIVLGIIGLAAGLSTSTYGQGTIKLDNYDITGPLITYGAGSNGALGTGINNTYTVGLYYWNAVGNNTGSVPADPSNIAIPSVLNASLLLGTGSGATTAAGYGGIAGDYSSGPVFNIPGSNIAGGETWTIMLIAYNGASYAAAADRGHSAAFTIQTSANTSPAPTQVYAPFSVYGVPEPTTLALGGLGGLALLLMRRKQS